MSNEKKDLNKSVEIEENVEQVDSTLVENIEAVGQIILGEVEKIGGILLADPIAQAEGDYNIEAGKLQKELADELAETEPNKENSGD